MAKNTFFGKLFGNGDAPTQDNLQKLTAGAVDSNGNIVGAPPPPTPISPQSAEYAAAQKQASIRGRAANMLTGSSGSLVSSSNLASASKQLLGS